MTSDELIAQPRIRLGAPDEQVVISGNYRLALMYECIAQAWRIGVPDGDYPWSAVSAGIAFICVVPGYDRHFAMCEAFGIRMISAAMLDDGPDIEAIKQLVCILVALSILLGAQKIIQKTASYDFFVFFVPRTTTESEGPRSGLADFSESQKRQSPE
ncbi:hypothetical protein [Pseudomonas sp. TH39(2020)]|uniref:hypothetical protein n=1 Tax=Pseudomonas sp. TH39(2020) TaxID=2796349 RepID=UPI00313CE689